MSSEIIRCGVVGVGRMGRHHARIYAQMPEAELVGVVDADAERRNDITSEWGGRPLETVRELIDLQLDVLVHPVVRVDSSHVILQISIHTMELTTSCEIYCVSFHDATMLMDRPRRT